MPKWPLKSRTANVALVWLLAIAAWEAGYRVIGWKHWVFPAPSHVVDATFDMVNVHTAFSAPIDAGWPFPPADQAARPSTPGGAMLPRAILVSGVRLLAGFTLSLLLGGVLGLLMWRFKFIDALFGPVFLGLQTLPSVCWVPVAILLLGINEASIVFVLVMGSFFAIAIALRDGLRQTPPIYGRAALMLGARGFTMYRYVLLPAALPAAANSLRQGFTFAWRSLMGGELVFILQRRGLGFLLYMGRELADIAQVIAVMTVMVLIGVLADRLVFARIERRVRTRFGLTG